MGRDRQGLGRTIGQGLFNGERGGPIGKGKGIIYCVFCLLSSFIENIVHVYASYGQKTSVS